MSDFSTSLKDWLSSTMWFLGSRAKAASKKLHLNRRRPELETLEGRVLPSARPIIHDDFADTDGINQVRIRVLANDASGVGFNRSSLTVVKAPLHGSTLVLPSGRIGFTPKAGFSGTDSFKYRVADKLGRLSKLGTVTVIVHRPTANADFADTDGVNPVEINVLENDFDPDGALAPSTITFTQKPAHGHVALNPANGVVTYTPNAGFRGTDGLLYKVRDVHGVLSNPATVTLIVHQPKAGDDFATTNVNSPVTIDVAENDKDPDGALLDNSVTISQAPGHGTTQVNPTTGEVTYTPNSGFTGTDRFLYRISDEHGVLANPATVTVVVRGLNQVNDKVFDTDGSAPVNVASVDANDDAKGLNPAAVTIVTRPKAGFVTVNSLNGHMIYKAPAGFEGTVGFSYALNRGCTATNVTVIATRTTRRE